MASRKLQQIGQSLFVSLPKQWTNNQKLKKADEVNIQTNTDGSLEVRAAKLKPIQKRKATINYDSAYRRRIFREYFAQTRDITIKLDGKKTRELHAFLNNFLNLQVMHETTEKIDLRVLQIEEIGIQDAYMRMHHLTISMLNSKKEQDEKRIQDLEVTITQFYYLLVQQVRRFLGEGQYLHGNLTLLRAMDYRLAAEKLERIADLIPQIKDLNKIDETKKYVGECALHFANEEFEKSLSTWSKQRKLREEISDPALIQIIALGRQISGLAR